jgi:carbonic anhydrase
VGSGPGGERNHVQRCFDWRKGVLSHEQFGFSDTVPRTPGVNCWRKWTGDALIEAAIKENVHVSATDVLAHSEVLRHAKEQGKLAVVEAEYQLDTGEVVRLDKAAQ